LDEEGGRGENEGGDGWKAKDLEVQGEGVLKVGTIYLEHAPSAQEQGSELSEGVQRIVEELGERGKRGEQINPVKIRILAPSRSYHPNLAILESLA
jgi:hypothetical protein